MPAVFVKHLDNGHTEFRFVYDEWAVSVMRSVFTMDRAWDAARKVWTVFDKNEAIRVIAEFKEAQWVVNISGEKQRAYEREKASEEGPNFSSTSNNVQAEQAFKLIFALVPYDRRDALYKALVRVFHPDVGGSDEHMKALNECAGR